MNLLSMHKFHSKNKSNKFKVLDLDPRNVNLNIQIYVNDVG